MVLSSSFTNLLVMVAACGAMMDVDDGSGNILKSLPCVQRLNQLQCNGTGPSYPMNKIATFTDDNKALLRRMFGDNQEPRPPPVPQPGPAFTIVRTFGHSFVSTHPLVKGQFASAPKFQRFRRDVLEGTLEEMQVEEENLADRKKRQAEFPGAPEQDNTKADVCESKVEVSTPFWASNSNGKVRAILNNKEFEQAIHQEICTQPSTLRCNRDCSCEQKYKWHRLLAYDPNNDCAGIFMDWFLFPSCCVCRCNKNPFLG